MTTSEAVEQRYSELQPGYQMPTLRVVPNLSGDGPGSREDHFREVGYRGRVLWGPNLWGYANNLFREYFGVAWTASGQCAMDIRRPMYAGTDILVGAEVTERSNAGVDFDLWVADENGERGVLGGAHFPFIDSARQEPNPAYVVPDDFVNTQSWERGHLPVDIPCTPYIETVDAEASLASAQEVQDESIIYSQLVHPRVFLVNSFLKIKTDRPQSDGGQKQRRAGIHVGSETISYRPAPVGGTYRWYGTYLDERVSSKGDQWGRKEVLVLDEQGRAVFKTINKFIFNPSEERKEGGR